MFMSPIVANYFITKSQNNDVDMSKIKLNRLVFLSHAYYLAHYSKPLIIDNVVCSEYGLFIPNLALHLGDPLTRIKDVIAGFPNVFAIRGNAYMVELFDRVWKKYQHLNGLELSSLLDTETNLKNKHLSPLSSKENGPIVHNDEIEKEYKKLIVNF